MKLKTCQRNLRILAAIIYCFVFPSRCCNLAGIYICCHACAHTTMSSNALMQIETPDTSLTIQHLLVNLPSISPLLMFHAAFIFLLTSLSTSLYSSPASVHFCCFSCCLWSHRCRTSFVTQGFLQLLRALPLDFAWVSTSLSKSKTASNFP